MVRALILASVLMFSAVAVMTTDVEENGVGLIWCSAKTYCYTGSHCCSTTSCCPDSRYCCGGGRFCCALANSQLGGEIIPAIFSKKGNM